MQVFVNMWAVISWKEKEPVKTKPNHKLLNIGRKGSSPTKECYRLYFEKKNQEMFS